MIEAASPPRVAFGVPGLDNVLLGGIPQDGLFLVQGFPGSGKTTIALQFLLHGAKAGETCLLVSNAETPEQLRSIARSHGWSLDGIHVMSWQDQPDGDGDDSAEYTLFPEAEVEVGESLSQLFSEVERLRPTRLVIDTISALRGMAPSSTFFRRQLRRIRDFLANYACTTVILDDATVGESDRRSQTLADGLLELRQIEFEFGGDRRRLLVRKLRGCTYIGGLHDFRIKTGGVVVYPRLVARRHATAASLDPAPSGLGTLDSLVGGGLPRGSSTLIMGPAGIGKSTLATVYLHAAARRGERCSVCLFDESSTTFIERSKGLGIDLADDIAAGRILLQQIDPAELSVGEISDFLVRQVEEEGVSFVIIDTLNGYLHSAAEEPMVLLHLRELLSYLSRRQVVMVMVLTQHGLLGNYMGTPLDISFLADNVFLLRFFEVRGDIRQALSVVKKRTGRHERTIRELTMAADGILLSEPLENLVGVLGGMPVLDPSAGPGRV